MLNYALPARVYHHSIVELDDTDRFTSGGQDYIPLRADGDGYVMRHERDGREIFMGHAEIHRLLTEKRATIHYGYNSVPEQKLRLIWGDETFESLEPEKRVLPSLREKLILRYEEECMKAGKALPRSEKKLQHLLDAWADEIPKEAKGKRRKRSKSGNTSFGAPTVRQFNRDYANYMSCGRKTLALAHRHHGPGKRLFASCAESMAVAYRGARRYLSRKRPTKAHCYLLYRAELFEINQTRNTKLHKVSRTKFESMINRFDAFEKDASRFGEKWAVDKYARNLRTYDILAPGQRVEIDEVNMDLMTLLVETGLYEGLPEWLRAKIPKVRIWFVAAIDVATRYVLALRATFTPTANAAVAALRMIMTDKRLLSQSVGAKTPWIGMLRPKEVYSDNGSAFIAERTRSIFKAALVSTTCPPAGDPARRPFIESLFHSIGPMIAQFFDGRTFGSVVEKGDYKPEEFISLTTDEFVRMFTYAVCDIYHNKPHASLGGNSPHNAWVRATQECRVRAVPSDEEMLHIFGVASKRPISDDGITSQAITYGSDELNVQRMRHGRREFDIKTDPENVRWIAVKGDEGWFTVENTVGIADDITLAEWIAARREELAHNAAEAEDGMAAVYAAVNRLRRAGESATARAHLSPAIPDAKDYERMEREVMRGWKPGARRSGPLPELVSEMSPPTDPLRGAPWRGLPIDPLKSVLPLPRQGPKTRLLRGPSRSIPLSTTMRKTDMTNAKHLETSSFAAIKASVRASYFTTGRDEKLASYLREMAVNVTDWEQGDGSKRRALFIIGDSGSGKTRSLQYHFATMPEFQPYQNEHGETVSPVLSIDAPRPCNTKALAITILTAMGLPTRERMTEHALFAVLKAQLRERGVKYLHVDEMQHVMRHNTSSAIRHVQDTLKSLIQMTDWPLHTIYSGVPELAELLKGDFQLANRSRVLRYDPLGCPADAQWIRSVVEKVAIEGCVLALSDDVREDEFLEKLCLAANGAFGSMIAMVQEACFLALERGRKSVSIKEFARNYERDTGCKRHDNVFTAARWRDLLPGHALADLHREGPY